MWTPRGRLSNTALEGGRVSGWGMGTESESHSQVAVETVATGGHTERSHQLVARVTHVVGNSVASGKLEGGPHIPKIILESVQHPDC